MSIRAVVVDQNVPGKLVIREVPDPVAGPSDTIVSVSATSLNLGEVRYSQGWETGTPVGWDLAGVVETAAADGSGPSVGSRVAGFIAGGAWAEKVAIPSSALGIVPAAVSFTQAATLPVAGLTAYHALKQRGDLLGRRVLITGASGGVGHFAVQLAKAAGAYTVALLRNESKRGLVDAAKPDSVVVNTDAKAAGEFGPYDLVVEAVGGETFAGALTLLAKDGVLVTFATTSASEVTFPLGSFFGNGGNKIYGLTLFHEVVAEPAGIGLAVLGRLVADGRLVPHVDIETSWENVADIAQQMLDRKIQGKAVMTIAG